ncbi:MAG: aa3-type cytochrome c oxidase subunit IV [Propylenella sp.]
MAEHTHSGPVELGASMDYTEHDRTYSGFLGLTKITILASVATLQSLALFGLANNGFWLGALMILLMGAGSVVGVIAKGSGKALVGVVIIGFVLMALALG